MFKKILPMLKGGPGSGNFNHGGRPGERGGSSKEGGPSEKKPKARKATYKGEQLTHRDIEHHQNSRTRADRGTDEEYISAIKQLHGVKTSFADTVDLESQLAVHEALAKTYPGAVHYMREEGVTVRVIQKGDVPDEDLRVKIGSMEFTKAGHADFVNKEILIVTPVQTNYHEVSNTAAHEAGHWGVNALLATSSEAANVENKLDAARDSVLNAVRTHGSDSPEALGWKEKRDELQETYDRDYKPIREAIGAFDFASQKEGGVTNYSDSYLRQTRFMDIMEYAGDSPARYETNSRPIGARAAITRMANENFAEISGKINDGFLKKDYYLKELKKQKPLTHRTFMKLNSFLNKPFKYVKVVRA